jgi:multiple sugar transport system permease protein
VGAASAAAEVGERRFRHVAERRGFLATLLISPAVLFILATLGIPFGWAIYLSLTDATGGSLFGHWVGFHNFSAQFHNATFRGALWHTVLYTLISQAIVVVGAGLLAHALVRKFRGKWFLRFLILLPWAAPLALSTIGFLWFFDPSFSIFNWFLRHTWLPEHLHLISKTNPTNWLGTPRDAAASIIAVEAWRILPFATVIFLAGIASIPQEVDDAAAIDGATGLKKFWYVSLPLQLPIALVALLFGIIFTATDMTVPYLLTNGGPFNSTQVLTTWAFQTGIGSGDVGEGAAISLFLLPVLALVVIGMLLSARRVEVS